MEEIFFKLRKAWKLRKNKFDLGGFFAVERFHIPGYLVMCIFSLKENQYLPFYRYHLKYYFENNPLGNEETFLSRVIDYVDKDIKSRETLHYYKKITKTRIYRLTKFKEALKQIDKWEITLTNEDRIKKSVSYVQEIMNWQNTNDTKSVLSKLLFDEVGSEKFFIEYKRIIEERDRLKGELADKISELNKQKKVQSRSTYNEDSDC